MRLCMTTRLTTRPAGPLEYDVSIQVGGRRERDFTQTFWSYPNAGSNVLDWLSLLSARMLNKRQAAVNKSRWFI